MLSTLGTQSPTRKLSLSVQVLRQKRLDTAVADSHCQSRASKAQPQAGCLLPHEYLWGVHIYNWRAAILFQDMKWKVFIMLQWTCARDTEQSSAASSFPLIWEVSQMISRNNNPHHGLSTAVLTQQIPYHLPWEFSWQMCHTLHLVNVCPLQGGIGKDIFKSVWKTHS